MLESNVSDGFIVLVVVVFMFFCFSLLGDCSKGPKYRMGSRAIFKFGIDYTGCVISAPSGLPRILTRILQQIICRIPDCYCTSVFWASDVVPEAFDTPVHFLA